MLNVKRALYTASAVIFPVRCPFCGGLLPPHILYCQECSMRIPMLRHCDVPEGLDGMAACYEYTGAAREAVLKFKAGGDSHAAVAYSAMMTECCKDFIGEVDFITGVPSSAESLLRRGYMPAVALARGVSMYSGKPCRRTVRLTGGKSEQKGLDRAHRIENAGKGLKIVNKSYIEGKNILLVDDICTTGSTMSAVAALLKENGAVKVYGVAFAKTMLRG